MTTDQWALIVGRMAAWWPATKWSREMAAVWYEELREFDVAEVAVVMERLKLEPRDFAPSVGVVLAALDAQRHPEAPAWPEAWRMIGRAMRRHRYVEEAVVADLSGQHEALAAFVASHTVARLKMEPTEDPDYGGAVLRRLEASYADTVRRVREAGKSGRALAAVRRRGELGAASGPRRLSTSSIPRES